MLHKRPNGALFFAILQFSAYDGEYGFDRRGFMVETEVKFKVRAFGAIRKRLKSLGGKLIWKGVEKNFFFDTARGDLKKKKYHLRVRRWVGHSNSITLKVPPKRESRKYKVSHEHQIVFHDDVNIARRILKHLGFVEYGSYKKYREHWEFRGAVIELDRVKNLSFLEIEAPKKKIDALAKLFGLDWENSTTKGYLKILREAGIAYAKKI